MATFPNDIQECIVFVFFKMSDIMWKTFILEQAAK